MNEEMNYDEEFEGTDVVGTEDFSDNTDVEPENNSEGIGLGVLTVGGIALVGYTLGRLAEWGVKKAAAGVSGLMAKLKVKPDKDGCVAEAEAEDVDETEAAENSEQEEETVQKKSKRRK